MYRININTEHGTFTALFSEKGLTRLEFPSRDRWRPESADLLPPKVKQWKQWTAEAVEAVLIGRTPRALPPLDWSGATEFQVEVWKVLLAIKAGETKSYAEIATRLRKPAAARAVGNACGANPIPVLVPCHRVLAQGNQLGGFSGGLRWKKFLLEK